LNEWKLPDVDFRDTKEEERRIREEEYARKMEEIRWRSSCRVLSYYFNAWKKLYLYNEKKRLLEEAKKAEYNLFVNTLPKEAVLFGGLMEPGELLKRMFSSRKMGGGTLDIWQDKLRSSSLSADEQLEKLQNQLHKVEYDDRRCWKPSRNTHVPLDNDLFWKLVIFLQIEDEMVNLKQELWRYQLFESVFDDEKQQHDHFLDRFNFSPT